MKRIALVLLLIIPYLVNAQVSGGKYYVATNGSDSNPGTIDQPFATWQKGFKMAQPGDTVFFRGGVYHSIEVNNINPEAYGGPLGSSGTAENPIVYMSYPGEWAILDCSYHCDSIPDNPFGGKYNSAISIQYAEYLTFKDFEIRNVFQCDSVIDGAITSAYSCNLTFEHIVMHDIGQRGFYIASGVWSEYNGTDPNTPVDEPYWGYDHHDTTKFINCDAYNLCDSLVSNIGNAADGWKTIIYEGGYMLWEGCRAWNYTDDGVDPTGLKGKRVIKNCWFMAGDKYINTDGGDVERNGIKASGQFAHWYDPSVTYLTISNCLAYNCNSGIVELDAGGYVRNNALIYNNTIFKCGVGIRANAATETNPRTSIYKNNLVYGSTSYDPGGLKIPYDISLMTEDYIHSNNSWIWSENYPHFKSNPNFTINEKDFNNVDHEAIVANITAPRKADGSLPDMTALALAPTSDLIDGGTNVGLSYNDSAPDLGAFEYTVGAPTAKFSTSATSVNVGEEISFDASESSDDGNIVSYNWNFGDNTTGSGINATHGYSNDGTFNVQLTVTDNTGNTATATKTIIVNKIRTLEIISYSPNSTMDITNVSYYSPRDQSINISILNNSNIEVNSITQEALQGDNQVEVDLSGLPTGNYTINLSDESTSVSCQVYKEETRSLEILSYSPNPTSDVVNISYYSPKVQIINVSILNTNNYEVLTLTHNALEGENNQIEVDLTNLANGEYTITLTDETTSVSCQVIKEEARVLEIISYTAYPTSGFVNITYYSPNNQNIEISVVNSEGIQVLNSTHSASEGENNHTSVDISGLPSGVYIIYLSDNYTKTSCQVTSTNDSNPTEVLKLNDFTESSYDLFTVSYYCPNAGNVTIEVFNSTGMQIKKITESVTKGNSETKIDLTNAEAGEYRISLYDGITSVSCYVSKLEQEIPYEFEYLSSSPNPTVDLFAIEFTYTESALLTISVIDETGRTVLIEEYQANKGLNKAVVNLSELAAGNYSVKISDADTNVETTVTKQSFYQ
nr:T9SS type A sorting domain-containing protein [uncultured Carboxylicivirga sp.]